MLRRVPGPGRHRNHLQPVVVHGPHHGDWHRRQEWYSPAGRRSEVPGGRPSGGRKHDARRRAPPASHYDDRAGHRGRHASPRARSGRRLSNAATPGHRGDWWNPRLDGSLTGGNSGRSLLHRRPGLTKRSNSMKTLLTAGLLIATAFAAEGYKVLNKIKIGGAGGWDYVAVDNTNRRIYASHGTSVEVIDADAGKVLGTIPQLHGVHGIAIAPELNKGFISNGQSNSVTVFDLKTLAKLGEPATGQNPDSICYEPKTQRVFTFNGRSNDATVIDAKTNETVD